tara:strand:- start:438 stop:554 length:117 start_codon:yes stop_codon:yes gene_type:complete
LFVEDESDLTSAADDDDVVVVVDVVVVPAFMSFFVRVL